MFFLSSSLKALAVRDDQNLLVLSSENMIKIVTFARIYLQLIFLLDTKHERIDHGHWKKHPRIILQQKDRDFNIMHQ